MIKNLHCCWASVLADCLGSALLGLAGLHHRTLRGRFYPCRGVDHGGGGIDHAILRRSRNRVFRSRCNLDQKQSDQTAAAVNPRARRAVIQQGQDSPCQRALTGTLGPISLNTPGTACTLL